MGGTPQLLVRFVDGTTAVCSQKTAWRVFHVDGEAVEWCGAECVVPAVALRLRSGVGPMLGGTLGHAGSADESDAVGVLAGFGGVGSLRGASTEHGSPGRPMALPGLTAAAAAGGLDAAGFLPLLYRIPTIELDAYPVTEEVLALLSRELCETYVILPVSRSGGSLIVATAFPQEVAMLEAVGRATGLAVEPVLATRDAIRDAIGRHYRIPRERI